MVSEHLGPCTYVGLTLAAIHPTCIGQDGFFPLLFGLARAGVLDRSRLPRKRTKHQIVGKLLDLMEDAALVRDPIEMIIQGALKPWGTIADHQVGRLLCDALQIEGSKEGVPGVSRFTLRNLPMHDFPVSIGPYAERTQHHALLLAFDCATTPLAIFADLVSRIGDLDPHAVDQDNR